MHAQGDDRLHIERREQSGLFALDAPRPNERSPIPCEFAPLFRVVDEGVQSRGERDELRAGRGIVGRRGVG